jgi:hypothetical protein
LNSEKSWAARVLLWQMMRTGRSQRWITLAIVKVLPEPVTPRRVWYRFPAAMDPTSFSIAWGWSPVGL